MASPAQGPLLGYTGTTIDRVAGRRVDADWLQARLADPTTRIVRFIGDKPRIAIAGNPTAAIAYDGPAAIGRAAVGEAVFLGVNSEGAALFAVQSGPAPEGGADPEAIKLIDLRSLAVQGLLEAGELSLLAQAQALLYWHQRHRYCANCGAPTVVADGGYRRYCQRCEANHFPRTDPVVIIVAVHDGRCLLGRQPNFLPGVYSALAGFVEPGESLEEAARREVLEETGVRVGPIRYHSSQPWPFPANLMIGLLGEAETEPITVDRTELEDARWFDRRDIEAMLDGSHRDGLKVPPPMAIAYHLISAAVSG